MYMGEKNCSIIVENVGSAKAATIKVLREQTGLGLREAKNIVDKSPFTFDGKYDEQTANQIRWELQIAGAVVRIDTDEPSNTGFDSQWTNELESPVIVEKKVTEIDNTNSSIPKQNNVYDLNYIKQYLKDVYTLEKELYCSQLAKHETQNIKMNLGKPREIQAVQKPSISSTSFLLRSLFLLAIGGGVGTVISFLLARIIYSPVILMIPYTDIGIIIMLIYVVHSYKIKQEEYTRYQNELKREEDRIKGELEKASTFQESENKYTENINLCNEMLSKLYNMNIIFPKYRNFIAISQICEYFSSGRCVQLEGHEGAYNIFENELRQNVIISKLDNVLNQMEQIKQNQYLIYSAIQEGNSILAQIESNTSAIAYNTAVIANNTDISNRYNIG